MMRALFICVIAVLFAAPVYGNDAFSRCEDNNEKCSLPDDRGKSIANSRTIPEKGVPANTEKRSVGNGQINGECRAEGPSKDLPFMISVDGRPLDAGAPAHPADSQRCTDLAASKADIELRYDSLEQTPWLNVHATPDAGTKGSVVRFIGYSNYIPWIDRAEVRIYTTDKTIRQEPLAVVPIEIGEIKEWQVPSVKYDRLVYILRVYDRDNQFDETRVKLLHLSHKSWEDKGRTDELAGYGEDSRYVTNIPVNGGAVTVNGQGIKPGQSVSVMGMPVPIDSEGRFAARQILTAGPHRITVTVQDTNGMAAEFTRNISIASGDWFYMGMADLTLGQNNTSGPVRLVTTDPDDEYDEKIFVSGRLAFYLKGKIKGKYLLTAAADTREQPFEDLFRDFYSKDPRYLLRRLDPDRYYPVYGDDSTTLEDAPTQGKFYVKVKRGESHIMWGNFHTAITGTEFTRYSRGLYGANLKLQSSASTAYGEKRGTVDTFAADPGSLPARDEFRGTGGSLYYMRRMDITMGSERLWVEVRDRETGLVLETRYLAPAQDYDIDYLQGRVTLREPLSSTAESSTLVATSSLSGHPAYLVATYEYTPGLDPTEDKVIGGRTQYWVNDHLRLGFTGYQQDAPGMEQRTLGGDVILRYRPGTYIKLETAHSDEPGSGENSSLDGGFTFNTRTASGDKADAHRVEAGIDFSELSEEKKGRAKLYWQTREEGFSGPGQITGSDDVDQMGASVDWNVTEAVSLAVKADERQDEFSRTSSGEVDLNTDLNKDWSVGAGVRTDSRKVRSSTTSETLNESGDRTDAVLKVKYEPDQTDRKGKEWSVYGFVQGTVSHSDLREENNRAGMGGHRRINDKFVIRGEASDGSSGFGGLLGGDYQVNDRANIYINYEISTDRTDTGYRGRHGTLTGGSRIRFSDSVSVFGEERLQHGDGPSGLTHAFGLDLAPDDRWTYGLSVEAGDLSDPLSGDMHREAAGLSVGYHHNDVRYAGNIEFRSDDGDFTQRETWLGRNTLGYQLSDDWRYLGRFNASISEASQGDFYDGDYVEVVNGFAYRPVDNDRFNGLFKYTFFYNLPSAGQLTGSNSLADYSQRSHVLSVDGMYDIVPWLSIGGKYGMRLGELKDNRVDRGPWHRSMAHLYIARADLHWVHEWDVLVEGRMLDVREAEDIRSGALAGIYRHINRNVKVGVGYNFTDFSDDLTDLSYRHQGWFLNIIGKI